MGIKVTDKRNGESKVIKDKEKFLQYLLDSNENPDDFSFEEKPYSPPKELVKENKLNNLKAQYPLLAALAPAGLQNAVDGKGKPVRSGIEDGLSLPGRSIGAVLDAIFNKKRGDTYAGAYSKSLGQRRDEQSGELNERNVVEEIAQSVLRDPMLLPSIPIGGAVAGPALKIGMRGTTPATKFLMGDVLSPAVTGAATGAATEVARPLMTTDESEDIVDAAINGALFNTGLSAGGKGARIGYHKFLKPKLSNPQGTSLSENAVLGEYMGKILKEEIEKINALAIEKGIQKSPLDEIAPSIAQKMDDVIGLLEPLARRYAGPKKGEMNFNQLAQDVSKRSGANANALIAALDPEWLKRMETNYGHGLDLSDEILDYLKHSPGRVNKAKDAKDLAFEQFSDSPVANEAIADLIDFAKTFRRDKETALGSSLISKQNSAAATELEDVARKMQDAYTNPDGTTVVYPRDVSVGNLEEVRKDLFDRLHPKRNQIDPTGISTDGLKRMEDLYSRINEAIYGSLPSEAKAANVQRAKILATQEAIKKLGAGNNEITGVGSLAQKLENIPNPTFNGKKESFYKALKEHDELTGTDFANRALATSWAKSLMNGMPEGAPFQIGQTNLYGTGARGASDALTATEALALLADYQKIAPPVKPKAPAKTSKRQAPARIEDVEVAPPKQEIKIEEARERATELAEALGHKPGTKTYSDMVKHYIDTYMNSKSGLYSLIGQSTQKRGER